MADEAQLSVTLQFAKGTIPAQKMASGEVKVTVAGSVYMRNVQIIGNGAKEALLLGDVATPGYILVHNLDTTNFVTIFPDATNPATVLVRAGKWALFEFASGVTPNAQANTAPVNLEYFLLPV